MTLKYDLIYAQSGYVYSVLPDMPHFDAMNASGASHVVDGIAGYVSHPHPQPCTPPPMSYGQP